MAALIPAIQVIEKADHTVQHIVPLSPANANSDATPLDPNSVRIRSRLVALTTNNFAYARHGGLGVPGLDWYNVWPMPASLPAPYNDTTKYCRISAWGFSEVTESTIPELPVGTQLYGYQPIGTALETLTLEKEHEGHWLEGGAGITEGSEEAKRSKALDALFRPLFGSSFVLNRFAFGWEGNSVNPLGMKEIPWSAEDADLTGAVVFLLAPSGKTGLAFAHQLRKGRPADKQPRKIVAVGSAQSKEFTEKTGLFDEVVLYGAVDGDLTPVVGDKPAKILLVNFGGRGDAPEQWAEALRPVCERLQVVLVGSDPSDQNTKGMENLAALVRQPGSGVYQLNAGGMMEAGKAALGFSKYSEALDAASATFKADGAAGLKVSWGRGIDDFSKGWDALAKGEVGPDAGLVYELP
ncbi:hypothetical protein B0T16DRAFT_328568 [Cercophora newfieldiana]|uniref:Uncharacterized protein n=1 Tax=Cercophora newfieldiana TaxID=92897 RepID=A0AA39Y6U3_9PEZI|nr:hypothetical protein B0T16DRAFT_328568 [Cercophora newfieldiana]